MAADRCTCRRCNPGPLGSVLAVLGASFTTADRVESAGRRYVESLPTWGDGGLTVEWLEAELDEVLGITHARWVTRRMQRAARRAERRRRLAGVLR